MCVYHRKMTGGQNIAGYMINPSQTSRNQMQYRWQARQKGLTNNEELVGDVSKTRTHTQSSLRSVNNSRRGLVWWWRDLHWHGGNHGNKYTQQQTVYIEPQSTPPSTHTHTKIHTLWHPHIQTRKGIMQQTQSIVEWKEKHGSHLA